MAEPRPSEMSPSQLEKYLTELTAKRYRFYGWLSNAEKLNLETYEGIMQGIADKLIDRELNKLGSKRIVDLTNFSALSRCDKVGYGIGIINLMQTDFQYVDGMEVALLYWLNYAYQDFSLPRKIWPILNYAWIRKQKETNN